MALVRNNGIGVWTCFWDVTCGKIMFFGWCKEVHGIFPCQDGQEREVVLFSKDELPHLFFDGSPRSDENWPRSRRPKNHGSKLKI